MINIPKDLSDIEVGIYKSGYSYCESLVKVKHMAIAKAVENTAERYGALKMISDMDCFKEFLFREVTAYTEPSIGVSDPSLSEKIGGMNLSIHRVSSQNIGAVTMIIC